MPKSKSSEPVEEKPVAWENRIVKYDEMSPDDLLANPKNFRRHPVFQRRIFNSVANETGIVSPVILNDRTGLLIDGHMRVDEAKKAGMKSLPVVHVDLSPEEEATILLTFDAVSAMAVEDAAMKAELLKRAQSEDDDLNDYFEREFERQQAEAESGDSLSALGEKYGSHDPTSMWPVIRIRVPLEVRARFMAYFKGIVADDDVARVILLLDRLKAPHVKPEDVDED